MKKLLSLLVVLSMLAASLSGITLTAAAEDVATTLTPADDGYYYISSAADFNLIAATEAALTTPGNYRITADITEAITTSIPTFAGTITGWDAENNCTAQRIINISFTDDDVYIDGTNHRLGLFAVLGKNAVISNLELNGTITASSVETKTNLGALVGYAGNTAGSISNIVTNVTINTKANYVGGIAGSSVCAEIVNCKNTGDIKGNSYVGGILGETNSATATYRGLSNNGTISGPNTAGIFGEAKSVFSISDSYNNGTISGTSNKYAIVSYYHNNIDTATTPIIITNCYSTNEAFYPDVETWSKSGWDSTNCTLNVEANASYLTSDANGSETLKNQAALEAAGWAFYNETEAPNALWMYDAENLGYPYPQIKGLPAEEIVLAKDSEGYYLIHNAKEFNLIALNLSANYRIVSDITEPITEGLGEFKGTISGWDETANAPAQRNIKIELDDGDIYSNKYLGLIYLLKGTVSYITLNGSVTNTTDMTSGFVCGALAANVSDGTITNVINKATVSTTSKNGYVGGIIGIVNAATIQNCMNTVDVTGTTYVGGIASEFNNASLALKALVNRGAVTAKNGYAGGIVSDMKNSFSLTDSYNSGEVSGTKGSYGIGGIYHSTGIVNATAAKTISVVNCYSTSGTALMPTDPANELVSVDYSTSYLASDADSSKELKNQATLEAAGWVFYNESEAPDALWTYDEANPGYPYPQIKGLPFEAYFPLTQDADGYYLLNNLEDFKQITKITNGLSSKYKITADIEEEIDFSLGSFSGEIIGWDTETNKEAYRTIKIALTDEDHDGTNLGLINQLTGTGSVSYLTLEGSVSVTSSSTQNQSGYVAALVGNLAKTAKISHIINNASVTNARTNFSGGIAGIANGAIADCLNTAKITAKAYAGGIIGQAATMVSYNLSYDRLVNRGEISATNAGGITGAARYAFNINDSYNTGALSGTNCYGIVPYYHDRVSETSATVLTITNCYSTTGTALYRPVTSLENKPSEGNLTVTSVASYLATDEAADEALKSQQTLVAAGWDFEEIWSYDGKNKGYFYPQIKEFYLATTPGTISDPLDIATAAEFYAIKDKADADFYCELVSDIDLTTIEDYVPFDFSGVIYGNDKKITPSASGIFSNLTNATVSDLTIAAATVNGRAALAYDAGNLTLSDIINNADVVSNTDRNGGFIGYAASGKIVITNCINNGDVDGAGSNNGGFVGDAGQGVEAVNCVNNGDVNGSGNVGGIIGYNTQVSTVTNSINTGNVTSLGDILGQGGAGGILGSQRTDGASRKITITGCYNSGIVSTLKDPNGYGRYNPIISEIRPFDHTGKPVADASFAKVEVSDCYYLAVNPETDLDAYEGTTALSLEAFKAADERLADLTFYQFTVNSPENAYVSPASPSGKVYVKYGSDVIFLACPYDIGYAVDEENTNIPFVKDDKGNYYTYKISNVNFNAEYNIAIKSVVVFGSIKTPDFAVERDALLSYAANGLKDYLKISSDKAGFLLYSSVKDHAGEASEFGFEIEGFKVPVAQKTANGEFGAYIFSSKLDANTKYTVKAYAEIGDETVYSEAVLISPAIPE